MKMYRFKRILSLLLVVALLAGFYVPGAQAASTGLTWQETDKKIQPDLTDRLVQTHPEPAHQPGDPVRVSIVLEDKPTIQVGYSTRNIANNAEAMAYNAGLRAKQDALAQRISDQVLLGRKLEVVWNLTLAANLISATVPYGKIEAIAAVEGVKAVVLENTYTPCVVEQGEVAEPQMFASLGMTGSSLTWTSGYTGAGSRIAVIDTGTDTNHQSLDNGAFLYALQQNAKDAGLSYESYVAGLDLLDQQEIAAVLGKLNISSKISGLTAANLYINEKLPFAVNYVDYNLRVTHDYDDQGSHGSHVAGIATANRYIPSGSGYAKALDTVMMAGAAPDAQLITMKVFGASGGPSDSDYLSAVEDAIYLGCDSVNLSLGTSSPGYSYNDYFSQLLAYFTQTDTVVVASAGNSYAWPTASVFGYLYNEDVSMDTVGAPGSHTNFFTVASVENDGGIGTAFRAAGHTTMYADGVNGYNQPLSYLDVSTDKTGTDYEFVFIDGLGYPEDYAGMNLNGKVVFCSRGDLNFAVKANNAADLGAAATIVYNNDSTGLFGMDLSGYYYNNPCASISMEDAAAIRAAATARTTSGGITYYTGKITILGKEIGYLAGSDYYRMSDFSSWGVPGNLSLKPEITAPGGNIYSLNGMDTSGTAYELMSGTSMAAPAITGMAALVAQYLRETGLSETEGLSIRKLTQSLLMSTAEPLFEEDSGGNYYSLLKQGAGLARVDLAVAADSYILVEGQEDGKVKAELGDDPNRTGVYEFSFEIHNISGQATTYTLSADIFRQDVFEYEPNSDVFLLDYWTADLPASATFTVNGAPVSSGSNLSAYDLNGDGVTNAQDADYLLEYLVGNRSSIRGQSDVNGDGTVNTYDAHVLLTKLNSTAGVTVPANGTVTVDVRLQLTASGRQILEDNYPNGTYVEAFVYAESAPTQEGVAGTRHSIPVLAFYGNWSDPTMFDHGTAIENLYLANNTVPYLYQVVGAYGNSLTIDYGDGTEYYYGGNPYLEDNHYLPERNAFNSHNSSRIVSQDFSLIRNASEVYVTISNVQTGEEYYRRSLGEKTSAYYHVNASSWQDTIQEARINWAGTDTSGNRLREGTQVEVAVTAIPEYYRNADGTFKPDQLGKGATMSTQFTIDNTAPKASAITQTSETTLSVTVQDNRHVAAVILANAAGNMILAAESPNQTTANTSVTVNLDLYNLVGKNFLLSVCDYAGNETTYEIQLELPELARPHFTAIDTNTNDFVGMDIGGSTIHLPNTGLRSEVRAAERVGQHVFLITEDNNFYVASDKDLSLICRIGQLDPDQELLLSLVSDMAYNHADGKLYALFYSYLNDEAYPYLCTIDMANGDLRLVAVLPTDVNTLAIDTQGKFYSVGYADNDLYTYTLADVTSANPAMSHVGQTGYYYSDYLSSMAWDHNTGTLYWVVSNSLVKINSKTAEPTLLGYQTETLVGLYTRSENDANKFPEVSHVDRVQLGKETATVLLDQQISLEAVVWPWNASDRSVTWSSANTSVATVDQNGVVTGIREGTTTITATSNLDRSKTASCVVTVETLGREINAVIWDEEGSVIWGKFNPDTLPAYTKLAAEANGLPFTSTAYIGNTLYASALDTANGFSTLYKVNTSTFAATKIGQSSVAYLDLAYSPHSGYFLAPYFNYITVADPTTGDYIGAWDWSDNIAGDIIGITYYGSEYNSDYSAYMDYFLILNANGDVFLDAFILLDDGQMGYFNGPQYGFVTNIGDAVDISYFQGFHYDGEYVYWSRFNEGDNQVELLVWDCNGSNTVYNLGTFPEGVWPVGGLYTDPALPNNGPLINSFRTTTVSSNALITELEPIFRNSQAEGTLNSVSQQSSGEYKEQEEQVTVKLTGADIAPNGKMIITYDASALTFAGITGHTEAFAYKAENGKITVAYASASQLSADTTVATLTFKPVKSGNHTVTISHLESGNKASSKKENLTVNVPATEPEYTVKWSSISTSLGGNIAMNFYVELSEDLVSDPNAYIQFTFAGRALKFPLSEGKPSQKNGVTVYQFSCPITSKNMTDEITAQIFNASGAVGASKSMSVDTYCKWVIDNFKDAKTVNLMKAMLNYGASAQLLFKYRTDDLANASLAASDKVFGAVDASAYKHSVVGTEDGIIAKSMTLLLDSETTVRVYFELTGNKPIESYKFTVDGVAVTPKYKDGKYYVERPNISAHRLDDMHVFTCGGITVTYGGLSYVNQVMTYYKSGTTFDMASALYAYSKAAEAYIG